jgi:hypothetical protein
MQICFKFMMRFLAATFFILVIVGNANADVDALCVKDCITLGNPQGYCISRCSFENNAKQSQLANFKRQTHEALQANAQCLKICSEEGLKYQSCQRLCSKLPSTGAGESEEPDADDYGSNPQ